MEYIMIAIVLIAFVIGGPILGALCGIAGVLSIFYFNFKGGPTLTLIAIPVAICFFLSITFEDLISMYIKYISIYVLIFLVVSTIICHFIFEEEYGKIVIALNIGFIAITMGILTSWMYLPKNFPVPNKVNKIQIQKMDESIQVIYTKEDDIEKLLEKLERVEMRGTFKELFEFKGKENIYRLTFLNKKDKEIDTYYFYSKYYVAKAKGNKLVYYRWSDDSTFPYDKLISMHNDVISPKK